MEAIRVKDKEWKLAGVHPGNRRRIKKRIFLQNP